MLLPLLILIRFQDERSIKKINLLQRLFSMYLQQIPDSLVKDERMSISRYSKFRRLLPDYHSADLQLF